MDYLVWSIEKHLDFLDAIEWKVGESVFRIVKIKKKVEVCVRHVPQVLLRGEHVVMLAPENNNSNSSSEIQVKSEK